ncbi:unnamed protein product [Rotaria sordida]|uniref:Uncharacterized protein n=1 Tax=Rotaria sordida TaxID=392033 RepID=A0A813RA70_9BILA|nr:unnamed protein product [Rotaria sordida]
MLKPERITFSADDDKFNQFTNNDQLNSFLNDSLVHYSTDFIKSDQQVSTSVKHSNSFDQLSSITMSSQQQQQEQQQQEEAEHIPSTSAPPSLISEENPILNENTIHQFDALTLQQLAIGNHQNLSDIHEDNIKPSPSHSTSLIDIQKEVDRVRQMKYNRTYSSPTASFCSRITKNPFNGTNNNIDLSSITQSVHFTEETNQTNCLPFSSTFIASIPESIVPATTNDNHFIPIHHIESPSLEDREVFETFHIKQASIPGVAIRQSVNSLNRNISTSETDLIASLHRSASKQGLDNQSDHGTTYSGVSDDMIFSEWDKERNLFQDYINSLRTEIRVLLQERSEYQKQIETINNNLGEHKRLNVTQINIDQTKLDLLKKSLEEKNLVLEQLQKEYEIIKEKNINLTRKVSVLRCDAKAQTGVIDELKQKIAELTVDIQNHIIVKRRLEISMMNLESDCKMIDTDRIRLTNDIKVVQLSKQDLEKLLQQANVQIAEQGSTIEMLRSDNIQIRSQLSTTQRRMLQEKQQVMDYLRQIENDLIEKEQIKQRESILRKEYDKLQSIHKQDRQDIDQLNIQINQDKQKLDQLEQERLQLFKTIQNMDDNKIQLESDLNLYKSSTKRLYTYFKIPFDSIQSIDQLIPMLEDRYRTEQISQARIHHIPLVKSTSDINHEQETEEIQQLREDLHSMNIQFKQLNDANQAWQQYQQNQNILLCDRFKLTNIENLSFDDIIQQIENRFNIINNQLIELQNTKKIDDNLQNHIDEIPTVNAQLMRDDIHQSKYTQTENNEETQPLQKDESAEISIQSSTPNYEEELCKLRENFDTLTTQYTQLDEANRAWQQYHQIQLDNFKNKLQINLPIDNDLAFDDIAQYINTYIDQIKDEHESLTQQLQSSGKLMNDLRSELADSNKLTQETYDSTINELNQKILMLKQQNDQIETERKTLIPDSISSDSQLFNKQISGSPIQEPKIHTVTSIQSASPVVDEREQELQQLRDNVALLTTQCAQLNEANRAWQLYQEAQLQNFRSKLHDYLSFDENTSLDSIAQQIVEQLSKEREDFNEKYQTLEKANDVLCSESTSNLESILESYMNTINELNQELLVMKKQCEELDAEKQLLTDELQKRPVDIDRDHAEQTIQKMSSDTLKQPFEQVPIHMSDVNIEEERKELQQLRDNTPLKSSETVDQQEVEEIQQLRENLISLTAQLDVTKQTWQQYQQTQFDILRNQLQDCLSIDSNITFDEIAQQIVDQVTKEREDFTGKYQELEKQNDNLRSELTNNMESIRESYVNTVNELNQELLIMKKQCEQFDAENQLLTNELEKQSIQIHEEQIEPTIEKIPLNILKQPFEEVPIHTSSMNVEDEGKELEQLRERVAHLTTQCAQLDEANRAWQLYQEAQLENFRSKLHDCLSFDEDMSFDMIAQQIVEQISKEREDFNEKYQTLEKANDVLRSESTSNLESIQQSYINTIDELNQELLVMKKQCEDLDAEKQVLSNELEKQSVEVDQNYPKQTTEKVSSNILRQPFEEIPTHMSGVTAEEERKDLEQLQETVAFLTTQCAQLDEANRAWQQYQEAQLQNFRSKLHDYFSIDENTSFDMIAQQIVEQISKEREDFNERYQAIEKADVLLHPELTNNFESVEESYRNTINELNQELLAVKTQCEHLDAEKQLLSNELEKRSAQVNQEQIERSTEKVSLNLMKQPFEEVPIHTSVVDEQNELEQLREAVTFLTAQCAQLDEANRAWQQYQQTQLHVFLSKLHDYLPIEESTSFDEIAQHIVNQIIQEREDFNIRYEALEKELNNLRSESGINIQSDVNTVNKLNEELLAIKEAYEKLDAEKQLLVMQLESLSTRSEPKQTIEKISWNEPFEKVPIHTTIKEDVEELEQLRERVALLTNQCTQLDESNRTWQQYQQTQLDNFRNKLHDYLPIDENISLDDIAQQIIKDHENFNEKYSELEKINDNLLSELTMNIQSVEKSSTDNIDELNEELFILKNQNEELEKINKQLLEKENLNNPLSDRSIVLGHHSGSELNIIQEETPMELKENLELQSSSPIPIETEEINKIRSDLALITCQFNQLTETNQNELDLFRSKLQNWISLSPNSTLDEIAQLLDNQFEQKYNLETIENSTQTIEPSEKIHISTETIPILYENHQTQIDPIDMINQEIQTESFQQLWSISHDENLFPTDEEDNHLQDYIDEIYSLSSNDLSNRLNKECQQILTKKNISLDSNENYQLNHLALITIYLLYHQHLTDDAKQLYNETLIRALKQEYELINNEKNDYIEKYNYIEEKYLNELNINEKNFHNLQNKYDELLEHNELERLDSKKSLDDLIEQYNLHEKQYEFNLYNLHNENENLKFNLNTLQDNYDKLLEKNHEQLDIEYQQLRQDYNELINENELLKDYNSRMYQAKLQDNNDSVEIKSSHDIDIQCNISEELSWNKNWNDESTHQDLSNQEEKLTQLSNDDEINQLKTILSDIQLENEHLKDLNSQLYQTKLQNLDSITDQTIIKSHDIDIQCLIQPITIDNYIQTEIENEQYQIIPTTSSETEDNDWNNQISPIRISSIMTKHIIQETIDNETQTDEQLQDKTIQINNKLKRALQTIKDRIHQIVIEQPELFSHINDDTIERLDHLISTIKNQAIQIHLLQNEHENILNKLHQTEIQSNVPMDRDSEQDIRLNEYENQIKSLIYERDILLEQNKQLEKNIQSNTDIISSNQTISNDNSTQTDFNSEEQHIENTNINENEQSNITNRLFGFISNVTSSSSSINEIIHRETQTDEQLQDKTIQINNKLKRALQTIKDRIYQIVIEQPELFSHINDDTIERLDHLISTIRNQFIQINNLQNSYDEAQHEINQLQSSLEACQYQIDNEHIIKTEKLVSTTPLVDDISQSTIEDYEKQIHQLQQKLSQNNDERTLLRERLNEVELEFRKTLDDHLSTTNMYEEQLQSLVQERDAFVQQQVLQTTENQYEIEKLQEELAQLKQSSITSHVDIPSNEDTKSLQKIIEQQSEELKDLSEKYLVLSSQVELQNEINRQKNETEEQLKIYEDQIQHLIHEHENLVEELQKKTLSTIVTVDNECQTDDQQHDKLTQINMKLKRILQTFKDKIHRIVIEKPELFINISEDTSERLDHLISTIGHQATQINLLQTDHASTLAMYEEQLQTLIQERNALVDQQVLQSVDKQQESTELKQSLISQQDVDEDNQSLKEIIKQQSEELKDLNEKYFNLSSQFDSNINLQLEFHKEKKEMEERIINYENQIQNLIHERTNLLEEIKKITSSPVPTIDNEKQTTDKLLKINNKLKRILQIFKDKIHRLVTERPDLFINIGEETSERLDHLIATVEYQATQIDLLQTERDQSEKQLQNQIQELQNSLDACRYQIENERPIKTEQLVNATPPSDDISRATIENYEKQIHQLQQKLSQNDDERTLLRERLNEVELEFRKTLDDRLSTTNMYEEQLQSLVQERDALVQQQVLQTTENQYEIEKLQEELAQLKQLSSTEQRNIPSDDDIKSLHEIIEQQSEQLKSLNEKYVAITASQLEFDRQRKETEERMINYENQIQNLIHERTNLLEEIKKITSSPVPTIDNEKQTTDKLLKINNKLKRVLQIFKDKIHRLVIEKPDLFINIGEETSERLDHLIATVENQATQNEKLQAERNEIEERFLHDINELQNSFDIYRQQIDNEYHMKLNEYISSSSLKTQPIETELIEHRKEIQPLQTSNDWFMDSPSIIDTEKQHREIQHVEIQCELLVDNDQSINKTSDSIDHQQQPTVTNRLLGFFKNVTSPWSEQTTNDWDEQNSPIQFPSEEPLSTSSNNNLLEIIKTKLEEIISEYPDLFSNTNGDIIEIFDQVISIIRNLQNQIKDLQSLSIVEKYQKEIDELKENLHENNIIYQQELQCLINERDQAREQLQEKDNYSLKSYNSTEAQTSFDIDCNLTESRLSECQSQLDVLLRERISLMEQIKQLAHQPIKRHIEIQTENDNELSTRPEQRISRRVFEQEILAWSKESEQLKQYVKQIQIENKKLTDIILKLESIVHDYMHENDRLRQENQHLSFLQINDNQEYFTSSSSDTDICYLTLKWLTYEVAQRTSNTNEQSLLITDNNEPYLKQRLYDTERQLKSIRIQNQRLKKQLETYTIQFKHIQHEMNSKIQELSTLKIEIDKLRTSETQYRLEVDCLKADLQCNQVKFQQLEREISDLKLEQMNTDSNSTNNLRELLELKERELKALKEKLDYTIQAHQLELQEAIKSNQFSLDNVQRFEQLDQRHQEKRKELEIRLGKFCKAIKPLIDNQHLFTDNSIIDIDELQGLIAETEAEERVTSSLGPIRDCLGLLESQMKELHHNLIENHARRSKRWKYKLGFECLSCDSQWEVTHDIQNLQEACQDPNMFLESSRVEPMMGCSCPIIDDFIENDVRLCIDDLLDEVIVRTIVK